MELGYLGDRREWTSLGLDGLNGRAHFREIDDPERFSKHFRLEPWQERDGYALVMAQIAGDSSIRGVDIETWYRSVIGDLTKRGWEVRFRPHPLEVERTIKKGLAFSKTVPGAVTTTGSLAEDLAGAGLVVTYNSNSGVDAAVAGVPP